MEPRLHQAGYSTKFIALALFLMTLAGLAVRWYAAWASHFQVHADEAIGSLMGLHIARGQDFPLYYYGQNYMGSFQSWLEAPLYLLTDWRGPVIHRMVSIALSLCAIPLTYWFGAIAAGPVSGLWAALYVACAPTMPVVYEIMGMAGSVEIQSFGLILAILTIQIIHNGAQSDQWGLFLMGLVGGLGFWINLQIVYFLVPSGLLLLISHPLIWRRRALWRGLTGFILGAMPMWIYNAGHDWATFREMWGAGWSPVINAETPWMVFSQNFLSKALPLILGGRVRWLNWEDLQPWWLSWSVYLVMAAALLAGVAHVVGALVRRRFTPITYILGVLAWVTILFTFSKWGRYSWGGTGDGRYLVSIVPLIGVLWGLLVAQLRQRMRAWTVCAVLPTLALSLSSWVVTDPSLYFQPTHFIYQGKPLPPDLLPLVSWLDERGLDALYTDYWIGYPLMLETRERLAVDTQFDRYPQPKHRVSASRRPAYLFHEKAANLPDHRRMFDRAGYQHETFPPFEVFYPALPQPSRINWAILGNAFHPDYPLHNVIDGDLEGSFWWDNEYGRVSEHWLEIDLGAQIPLEAVYLACTDAPENTAHASCIGPAGGIVSTSTDDNSWSIPTLLEPFPESDRVHSATCDGRLARYVRITQTQSSPEGPWSLNEVFIRPAKIP